MGDVDGGTGQVGAIRIGQDDRKEARLESAGVAAAAAWLLEEEVFIAQLHRRAQLLNQVNGD